MQLRSRRLVIPAPAGKPNKKQKAPPAKSQPETVFSARGEFESFPRLPLELREEIWRHVFTSDPWIVIQLIHTGIDPYYMSRENQEPCPAAGRTCIEARRVMQRYMLPLDLKWTSYKQPRMYRGRPQPPRPTHYSRCEWVDPERVVFFLARSAWLPEHTILTQIRHVAVQDEWMGLTSMLYMIKQTWGKDNSPGPLCSVTIIAPFDDGAMPEDSEEPEEDWDSLSFDSPAEVDWTPLTRDIESGEPQNRFQSEMASVLLDEFLGTWRGNKPKVFLRTGDEIRWPFPPPPYPDA